MLDSARAPGRPRCDATPPATGSIRRVPRCARSRRLRRAKLPLAMAVRLRGREGSATPTTAPGNCPRRRFAPWCGATASQAAHHPRGSAVHRGSALRRDRRGGGGVSGGTSAGSGALPRITCRHCAHGGARSLRAGHGAAASYPGKTPMPSSTSSISARKTGRPSSPETPKRLARRLMRALSERLEWGLVPAVPVPFRGWRDRTPRRSASTPGG